MGLHAFLMPQEPSPIEDVRPLSELDEVLISPPLSLSASHEDPGSTDIIPPMGGSIEVPSQSQPHTLGRRSSAPDRDIGPTMARAAGIVIDPPTLERRTTAIEAAQSGRALIDGPSSLHGPSSSAPHEITSGLVDFLAPAGVPDLPLLASEEVDWIEDEFISKSPLLEASWGASSAAVPLSAARSLWRDDAPPHPAGGALRSGDTASTPPSSGWTSSGANGSPDLGGGIEQVEERLSQVATRLEQAVQRLASPTLPLGQRPRPFRGRIDG